MAAYSLADPITTLENLATNLAIPIGALARFVLAKWASAGAQALLDVGPSTVDRMREVVATAEQEGTDDARLGAYQQLRLLLEWLGHGIDHPDSTYPDGGAAP